MLATALVNGYQQRLRSSGGGPNPQTPAQFLAELFAAGARKAVMDLILAEGRSAAVASASTEVDRTETINVIATGGP